MCPEPQMISIYMDGELPSPWKEKLEAHLSECSLCSEKLESFKMMHKLFFKDLSQGQNENAADEFAKEAKERVWQQLETSRTGNIRSARIYGQSRLTGRNYNVWKHKLSVPIPAIAAAAAIIVLITVLIVNSNSGGGNNNGFAYIPVLESPSNVSTNLILAGEEQIPGIVPTSDINSVLQYLGVDNPEIIIIKLPETGHFSRYGEPAILKAADHPASAPGESSPRRQAVVIEIISRVLEDGQTVVWSETNRSVSIPGVPVGVQLVGSNVVVTAQFTPYTRRDGNVLVAQGQIWIADEATGVTYYTSMQSIPMELGEPIYFYPLGSSRHLNPSIEIMLTVTPYEGGTLPRRSSNSGNDR